ncbi:hypothetical protein Tco_1450165 [Tanacetum coccineum]
MSNRKRSSKRKVRILIKFADIVCDLNKNKLGDSDKNKDNDQIGGNVENHNGECVVNGDDRDKEMDVIEMMNEFPTIDESMKKVMENVNDVGIESDELEPMINKCNDLEQHNSENCDVVNEVTCNHGLASNMKTTGLRFSSSYAKVTGNGDELSKELLYIPTGTNEHGLGEIIADNSDVSFFKFKSIKGMNYVIEQSLWMVNGSPFVSTRGISALASRLGRPIMMDNVTASMCHKGTGRAGYARILVEVDAKKGLQSQIEVVYKHAMHCTKNTKYCNKQVQTNLGGINGKSSTTEVVFGKVGNKDGFIEVRVKRNNGRMGYEQNTNKNQNVQKKVITKYVVKNFGNRITDKNQMKGKDNVEPKSNDKSGENEVRINESPPSLEKIWRFNNKTIDELRKCANKFSVLGNIEENKNNHDNMGADDRIIVDWFILKKQKPDEETVRKWTYDMKPYFKYRWEALNRGDEDSDEENDVIEDETIDGCLQKRSMGMIINS